ncbi:MAG: response regulator [Polaromonas sp.]|nr:response regulator [Polaromonas sp.]
MIYQLILVVEDNPDHLELTVLTLKEHGFAGEIAVACDGAAALNFLFGQGEHAGRDTRHQPNLVLLDMRLPKLPGLGVLHSIRGNPMTAMVPVVMLTSSINHSDMAASYQSGANAFVRKTVDFGVFSEKLKHLIAFWLGANETVLADYPGFER